MKKYWKSTAILAVIILSIGTFYVNSALSAPEYPAFLLKKQSGEEQALNGLTLESSYHETGSINYVSENLTITSDGSEYRGRSLIDQIIGQYAPLIEDLQKEHRHFMRGKGYSPDSYFENEQVLAYAEVTYSFDSTGATDFTFDIAVLDKQTNNTNAFTVKVPENLRNDHIYVEDVQVVDNLLHVITEKMVSTNDDYYNEKHIYTIDLDNQAVSNHEEVVSSARQRDGLDINMNLIETNPKQANEQLLFLKTEHEMIEDQESTTKEDASKELISYNLKTKKQTVIDLGEHLQENQVSFYDGTTIYLTKMKGGKLVVTPYNLESKQVDNPFTIELFSETDEIPMIKVYEGIFYAANWKTNLKNNAGVVVVDVNTRETLYKGEITTKEPKEDINEFELYIHDMSVR